MANNDPITAMLDDLDKWSKDRSLPFPESCRGALNIHNQSEEEKDYETIPIEQSDPCPEFIDDGDLTPEQQAVVDAWEDRQEIHAHDVFIDNVVRHGNRRIAYQKAYPFANDRSARTGAWRLMCKPEIANAVRKRLLEAKQQEIEVLREQYNQHIADIEEKRKILAQIIRGELVSQREVTKNGETQVVKQASDPKERIRAIVIDNRMEEEWLKAIALPDAGMKHLEKA